MKIQDFFNKINNQNVLVIGDVMIDAYLWGAVNRISPEAPVPVVSVTKRESRLGGAANVALNLKSLGINPLICSVIGADIAGDNYINLMQESQLSTDGLVRCEGRKTTQKTRVISDGQQLLRVDDEISYTISPDIESELISRIQALVEDIDISAIVFEDYDKGLITPSMIEAVSQLAKAKRIPVTVDPKKNNYSYYKNISLFKPNFKEFVEGSHLEILKADTEAIFKNAKRLIEEQKIEMVFVTLSELGVFICDKDNYHLIPAEYRQITDVSGAGDTVISVATVLLMNGFDKKTIASISNKAGGLVCEKVGVVPITTQDLIKEVETI